MRTGNNVHRSASSSIMVKLKTALTQSFYFNLNWEESGQHNKLFDNSNKENDGYKSNNKV